MRNVPDAPILSPHMGRACRWRQALYGSQLAQFLLLLAVAALLRAPAFGAWNFEVDDQFYHLIGQRLLHGDVLYVDVWDRKGPLLYIFYAACALLTASPWGYQIAATVCAALTGFGIACLARRVAGPGAALLGGLVYCIALLQFGGANGQAPVIYNPLVLAGAAAMILRVAVLRAGRIDGWLLAGTFAAGCAIAIKQSAAIEVAFFCAMAAWLLWCGRSSIGGFLAHLLALALAAALPMAITIVWYGLSGHFAELWQALVLSNISRGYYSPGERLWYLMILGGRLSLVLAFAAYGAVLSGGWRTQDREDAFVARFVSLWALVAIAAVIAFPAVFLHYALPPLVPLCILCAPTFGRAGIGRLAFASVSGVALLLGSLPTTLVNTRALHRTEAFERYVREQSPGHRIFVWGVPSGLYARLDSRPPSAILFGPHYYEASERSASGRAITDELRRVLAWKPEAVVVQDPLAMLEPNPATIAMLKTYLRQCRTRRRFDLADHLGQQTQWVYSGCASGTQPERAP